MIQTTRQTTVKLTLDDLNSMLRDAALAKMRSEGLPTDTAYYSMEWKIWMKADGAECDYGTVTFTEIVG